MKISTKKNKQSSEVNLQISGAIVKPQVLGNGHVKGVKLYDREEVWEVGKNIPPVPDDLPEPQLSENALYIGKTRYAKRNNSSEPVESAKEMFWRVAFNIAAANLQFDPDLDRLNTSAKQFYHLMASQRFIPNTPTMLNAGKAMQQLSACFVLPIEDDMRSIAQTLVDMVMIHKSGGGCIAQDARVWTTFCGIEPIEVLFARATIDGRKGVKVGSGEAFDVSDLGIKTASMNPKTGETGLKPVTHVWKYDIEADDQILVTTVEGTVIQTSSWHPFMVLRGIEMIEVMAKQLTKGDIVLGPSHPDKYWPWKKQKLVGSLKVTPDLGWLIGFTLSDGSFGYVPALRQYRVRWFSGTKDVLERVQKILSNYKINVSIQKDKRGLLSVATLNQKFVHDLLQACGLEKFGSKEDYIRVPEIIAKSPLSVVRAFLAGLLDGDGYVAPDGSTSYSTVSKVMSEDLAALVSLLGFCPSITVKNPDSKGKKVIYQVQICPLPQINLLAEQLLPFASCVLRKNRLGSLSKKGTALPLDFHPWRDHLASLSLVNIRGYKKNGPGPLGKELSIWASHGRIRRGDIEVIAKKLSKFDPKHSQLLLRVALAGHEIERVAIAQTKKTYYDLSVKDWNTYAAGQSGMLMIHNTGFSFSKLRPYGDHINSSGGTTVGPTSFLQAYNDVTSQVKQGGVRRGANMGILHITHPDILRFAVMKVDEFSLTNFNISVSVTEEWMEQVKKDSQFVTEEPKWEEIIEEIKVAQAIRDVDLKLKRIEDGVKKLYGLVRATEEGEGYELINPRTGQAVDRLNAKKVFLLITQLAWHYGDPGMIIIDRINNSPANPTPQLGMIESTNPCVTADTWVQTNFGPKQVSELIDSPFIALVDGKRYLSAEKGFFKTGTKNILSLHTKEGYSLRVTGNHLLKKITRATRHKVESIWCEAEKLHPGDKVLLHNHGSIQWAGKYTFNDGYLLGLLIGDGTLKKDKAVLSVWDKMPLDNRVMNMGVKSVMAATLEATSTLPRRGDFSGWLTVKGRGEYRLSLAYVKNLAQALGLQPGKKIITPSLEQTSSNFYEGFLRGLFDADGSVQGSQLKGVSVRLSQSNLEQLRAVQRMLLRLGIGSKIYKNRRLEGWSLLPNGKGKKQQYPIKNQHELVISGDNLIRFNKRVGFANSEKAQRLTLLLSSYKRALNKERFIATIENISCDGREDVYDTQIPEVHTFDANGFYAHNCGEQPLLPYDACTLGAVNVGKFVVKGEIDWQGLGEAVTLAVNFLDNVLDMNNYPIAAVNDMTRKVRRIGLGIMGFADMLVQLQVGYNTEEGLNVAEEVMGFINQQARVASLELGKIRGTFLAWEGSIYDPKSPYFCGEALKLRNGAITTIAPTGTTAMLADASSGIEPYFGISYAKNTIEGKRLFNTNPFFLKVATDEGFYSEELLEKIEANHGSVQGLAGVPLKWQKVFVVAHDIAPQWHVKIQAAFQKHVDNAISKTINFSHEAKVEDVRQAYLMVYELGCKGITIYRDGSREKQILEVKKDKSYYDQLAAGNTGKKQELSSELDGEMLTTRPMILRGRTYKVNTPVGKAFVTINRDEEDKPFEVFISIGKAGMHTAADAEAIGRLTSLALRISKSKSMEIAEEIVTQLRGIGGSYQIGFGKERVMSLADAVAKALAEEISQLKASKTENEQTEIIPLNLTLTESKEEKTETQLNLLSDKPLEQKMADFCPECGQATFTFIEGCKKCHSCGYSMC